MKYSTIPTADNNNNTKRASHVSYGLICAALIEKSVIVVVSPPYVSLNLYASHYKRKSLPPGQTLILNSNQGYDLMLGSFKNGFAEGTFTLPRGHCDKVDKNNKIRTKIREFIEETGLYHPLFQNHSNMDLYHNFDEEWIGLNDVQYKANYSLFIVKSMSEFIPVEKKHINRLLFPNDYYKSYKYNAKYDLFNKYNYISIDYLDMFLNNNKYKRLVDINVDRIRNIIKKYK